MHDRRGRTSDRIAATGAPKLALAAEHVIVYFKEKQPWLRSRPK